MPANANPKSLAGTPAGRDAPEPADASPPTQTGVAASASKVRVGRLEMPLLGLLSAGAMAWGWQMHRARDITPETGLGYALGIVGSLLMLMLLLYPLRKRLASMRFFGGVRGWFRLHMILGVVGPVLIVLHSNFSFGSMNSTVAFVSMLVVAGSGLVGRFLYARIHRGLYGRRLRVRDHFDSIGALHAQIVQDAPQAARIPELLSDYERRRLPDRRSLWPSIGRMLAGPASRKRFEHRLLEALGPVSVEALPAVRGHVKVFLRAVAKAEAFAVYERLFSLWHLLHLPLFIMLVLAAITHVVAVHLY